MTSNTVAEFVAGHPFQQAPPQPIQRPVSIEELAEDIARRTLLQSLTVRPVCDAEGNETGMFEIPAGGRRYRALELLVKQKSAEGWKWIEVAADFAYGHTYGLRQLRGEQVPLTEEEQAARDALQAEMDRLEESYAGADEFPEEVDQRLGEIETALAAFDDRAVAFDPEEVSRADAFVSIDGSGGLRIERGYVRPEDELPIEPGTEADGGAWRAAGRGRTGSE